MKNTVKLIGAVVAASVIFSMTALYLTGCGGDDNSSTGGNGGNGGTPIVPVEPTPDPTTWTLVTNSTFGGYDIRGITYGANKFVAVGGYGIIAYSATTE
jgi:hypothetical protein